jgi:hypothetical protein
MADPDSSHDFGKDIIPRMVKAGVAVAHPFEMSCVGGIGHPPYWRDVGTIDAYWDANIDLTATDPLLNLYDTNWPIWTYQPQLPPAKFVHNQEDRRGMAIESMVSGGCIVSGAVFRSILFSQVRVHSHSLGQLERAAAGRAGGPPRASRAPWSTATASSPTAWSSAKTPPPTPRASSAPIRASPWSRATCCANA